MNKLEEMSLFEAIKPTEQAARSIGGQSDNVSDLVMFLDSNGDCEVTFDEARQLMANLKLAIDSANVDLKKAITWQNALLCK